MDGAEHRAFVGPMEMSPITVVVKDTRVYKSARIHPNACSHGCISSCVIYTSIQLAFEKDESLLEWE